MITVYTREPFLRALSPGRPRGLGLTFSPRDPSFAGLYPAELVLVLGEMVYAVGFDFEILGSLKYLKVEKTGLEQNLIGRIHVLEIF